MNSLKGMYLGACRKGQKGESLMKQPYNPEVDAPRRAFSLKMAYMRTILEYVVQSGNNAVSNVSGIKFRLRIANLVVKVFAPFKLNLREQRYSFL